MSNKTQNIKSFQIVYPQVYSYTLPELPPNEGSQKIGYSGQENVHDRIHPQVNTPAFKLKYNLLWSAPAYFEDGKDFLDKSFHKFLVKKGIENRIDLGTEWFYFNGEPEKSRVLFDLFRKEGFAALQNNNGKLEYSLRAEQEDAVKNALEYFKKNEKGEFLWNAKPRFGKTLASYDLANRLKANKVLIVTNRPAIANSWFDDYKMFIDEYAFISETSSLKNKGVITREEHIRSKSIKPLITFLSLQDIKGSKYFGGPYDKLRWIADLEWDLLIIDEAHEGIDTGRTDAAFDVIKRKHTLHLSGTPFKALANEKFEKEAIYNWTYLDEQNIKQIEIKEGESGEHTDMPDLRLFTYRISQMITNQVNEGIDIENENFDYAFDLNEFFRAKDKKFIRENEVKEFLKNLTTNKKYPFSTPELREELKHTFWYVGNRVESVKALEKLLKEDAVFGDYKVIVAAGNGQTFEEEANDIKENESSLDKVKKAIRENDKTITLSCGQLTTGVTIKEWTAVLMLTDIKSPSLYMQAAFRAQNPYKELRNGELYVKKSAYLFDFAPSRVLEIYDQFANGLNPKAVSGEVTEKERKQNIQELLNFFPVISEDVNGEMIELDAEKVLTFPNALAATEIVNARFMTNLLFNDSLKGVFNFPKEVEEILNKMPEEKNKRAITTKETLDLDDARKVVDNKITKINENTEIILGEKIFKANTERVVDNLLKQYDEQISPEELVLSFSKVSDPLIAKYKAVYKSTQTETNEINKQLQEKVKLIAEEYNNSEIKDSIALKQKLIDAIEVDFVKNKVEEKEEEVVEKVQKTKEDEIRDRLRSFTRTIPMFIMANASKDEITIDNFDLEIDDKDFEELTSITKEEFHKIRDGFEYEENGVRKTFQGVFNKYRFNASIAEFKLKKEQLANYFEAKEDIFELIPNQKTNQIFTPKKLVQMMIDKLEENDPSLFTRTDSTFIDLYMKSGMYITEIVKKLFNNTKKQYTSDEDCLKHILENQVYGLAPTPILQGITQTYIFGFDIAQNISTKNFVQHDIVPHAQQRNSIEKLQELFKLKEDMKFDAVVGNPPYQLGDGSGISTDAAVPIYNKFIEQAKIMKPKYLSLIIPSKWMVGGRGLKKFREEMMEDKRLKMMYDYENASDCFPGVHIDGGVCYFIWDKDYDGKIDYTFKSNNGYINTSKTYLKNKYFEYVIRDNRILSILDKVAKGKGFSEIVSETKPFGIRKYLFNNPERYPESNLQSAPFENCVKIYGVKGVKGGAKRIIGFINRVTILKNQPSIDKYKLFFTTSYSTNAINPPETILGLPNEVCTETFLMIGHFETENEQLKCYNYINTDFFKTLLYFGKGTMQVTKSVFGLIPLQDFKEDWTDEKLYKKYGLTQDEISFIESMIKPMV